MKKLKANNSTAGYKTLDNKLVYQNQWMKLHEDAVIHPNGKKGIYGHMTSPPAVLLVVITNQSEIYLVEQPRYTFGNKNYLEIPSGSTDGEDPLRAAQRELREETGLLAQKWQELGATQPFNAFSSEVDYCYLAQELEQTGNNEQAEDGITKLVKLPFARVLEMIQNGEIVCGQSITAITLAGLRLGLLKP